MQKRKEVNLSIEYRIFETDRFIKDFKEITLSFRETIEEKLQDHVYPQLKQQPYFGPNIKKLKGWKPDTWRYKIGSWRFFYEIDTEEKIVFMLAAEHRSSAYRKK
ncbi:MAG: type II toxin-antitoxin system mRNA interferase toxin, RelE/StbE family [Candidatus Omnitrophica bacterium]|nr:type II toxin-antitoxin system mRNA interferase toxin, RelE/StbE family [Candidatus Omnitrophota bacterium]